MCIYGVLRIDVGLAQVEIDKKLALIKAWEENEKTKADNKYSFFLLCFSQIILLVYSFWMLC